MDIADVVMLAEDRHAERLERRETARDSAAESLAAEYMAAACVPLISTVSVPTDRQPGKRAPFIGVFEDDLSAPGRMARVVAILLRCQEGRELVEEMAQAHGDYYEEFCHE